MSKNIIKDYWEPNNKNNSWHIKTSWITSDNVNDFLIELQKQWKISKNNLDLIYISVHFLLKSKNIESWGSDNSWYILIKQYN